MILRRVNSAGSVLVVALSVATSSAAQVLLPDDDADPPLPVLSPGAGAANDANAERPASDRIRVALVDSGINYTLPDIASALARDAEGRPIGYDFWDLDDRPFDRHPDGRGGIVRHGTTTASVLIDEAPRARLVVYRYPRPDMTRMRDLIAHAAKNDVRVIGLPLGSNDRDEWLAFEAAAREYPNLLFIASAGNDGRDIDEEPVWPAASTLDNLLVVTSADDFGALAEGVNRGRRSVDYLVPAEHVSVLQFDGTRRFAAGTSFAVPRVVAMVARMLENERSWQAPELIAEIRRRFGDGSHPREVSEGFIVDPLAIGEDRAQVIAERAVEIDEKDIASRQRDPFADDVREVPLDALSVNAWWRDERIDTVLRKAGRILSACGLRLSPLRIRDIEAPARLADLSLGGSQTLFKAVRASGAERRATVVFGGDTLMRDAYDGEAFGRGNTRHRPWMSDSVWLTAEIADAGIALAHELFHILANDGSHVAGRDNLMAARTTGTNQALTPQQCQTLRDSGSRLGLIR